MTARPWAALGLAAAFALAPCPVRADPAGEEDEDEGEELPAAAERVEIEAELVRDADGTVHGVLFSPVAYRVLSGRLDECDVLDALAHAPLVERRPSCEPPEANTWGWILATVAVSAAIVGGYAVGRVTAP